jgi:hypothetical protein
LLATRATERVRVVCVLDAACDAIGERLDARALGLDVAGRPAAEQLESGKGDGEHNRHLRHDLP